jgi:hypothetical protein
MGGVSPILYRLVVPARHAKIYADVKLLAASHIFTNSCENSKILSRLLSVLSLHRKFVHDHCCCPKSAIILTASKLEAILDFWRGYRKSVPNDMGGGALPQPSNPDNIAAGGASYAQCGEGGMWRRWRRGWLVADNSP